MRPSTSRFSGVSAVLLLVLVGCGKGSGSLAEVTGTVMFDGKPLPGVVITFYPVSAASTDPRRAFSRATTDESGKFTLTCEDGRPGAVTGKHKVVVEWPVRYRNRDEPAKPPPTIAIPADYSDVTTTPLEKDVVAGSNTLPVELTRH